MRTGSTQIATSPADTATAPIPHTSPAALVTKPMTGGPASSPVVPIAATSVSGRVPALAAVTYTHGVTAAMPRPTQANPASAGTRPPIISAMPRPAPATVTPA